MDQGWIMDGSPEARLADDGLRCGLTEAWVHRLGLAGARVGR